MATAPEPEVQAFFDQYNEAFASIDGNRIAALYHVPTVTVEATGRSTASVREKSLRNSSRGSSTLIDATAFALRPGTISSLFPSGSAAPSRR
jgi:hypothetical protein